MARIVPAKPKASSSLAWDLLVELEGLLPDSYIIFQGLVGSDAMLLMAPERRALVILPAEGATGIDPDTRELLGEDEALDLDQVVQGMSGALTDLGVTEADMLLMSPGAKLSGACVSMGPAMGQGKLRAVADRGMLGEALEMGQGRETVSSINEALQAFWEGSSEYVPGTITDQQRAWREERGDAEVDPFLEATGPAPQEPASGPRPAVLTGPVRLPRRPAQLTLNAKSGPRVAYLKALLTACVRNISQGRPLFSSGVEVDPSFVAGPDLLLPAVLVAAAESWTPVVVKAGGIGGFDIRLSRDPQALIGFKVSDVLTASPTTLFMPVAHLIHSTLTEEGEFMLDEIVSTYYRWAQKYDLENAELEAIDLNIALKAIDSGMDE